MPVEIIPHEVIEEQELQDPAFRAEWAASALARAVALWAVRYRGQQGLSQKAFAKLLGLRPAQVALLERGDQHPSAELLARLASVAGVEFHIAVQTIEQVDRPVTSTHRANG